MRVVLRSAFDVYSGYGAEAVDIAIGLDAAGVDVVPMPTGLLPGLPREFTRLLEKDPLGRPDVVLSFMDPTKIRRRQAVKGVPSVLYTMWERTPVRPEDWPEDDREHADLSWLDRLLVSCPMNVDAFRPLAGDVPIAVVPGAIYPKQWPAAPRDAQRPLRFLMCGVMSRRKNPFAVLEAWRALCRDVPGWDAELTIHTTGRGLHPKIAEGTYGPGITLSTDMLPRSGMPALYHQHDVMICPSHGEGNNKPPMEFMATGGAVIASDWSGHRNWLHRDACWLVKGELGPVPGAPGAEEFRIDPDALYAAMLDAWQNRAATAQKQRAAADWAREALTWDRSIKLLVQELEAVS